MSDVQFEDPKFLADNKSYPEKASGPIIRLILKTGLAKTPAQVNAVMIALCVIFIVAAVLVVKLAI